MLNVNSLRNAKIVFFSAILLFSPVVWAQTNDLQLAKTYYEEGEWDKALTIYLKWYKNKTFRQDVYNHVLDIYLKQGKYDDALKYVNETKKKTTLISHDVDEYHIHKILKDNQAEKIKKKIFLRIKKQPHTSMSAAYRFKYYHYLDEALEVLDYYAKIRPASITYTQMADIYAEKGEIEKMMEYYLKALQIDPKFIYHVTAKLTRYITDNSENQYNLALKKQLIHKLQKNEHPVWLQLLEWLYVREKNFDKAFVFSKALYLQNNMYVSNLMNLAEDALENNQPVTTAKIFHFILSQKQLENQPVYQHALTSLLTLQAEIFKHPDSIKNLEKKIYQTIPRIHYSQYKADLFKTLLKIYTEKTRELNKALLLSDSLIQHFTPQKYRTKWEEYKGDILLYKKQFSDAAITYTLMRERNKSGEPGYRALYKIALASFFEHDFDWAHKNLKALKKATDKKIANDALKLDFIILSNYQKNDSLQKPLKVFADLYFEYFTGKHDDVIKKIDSILPLYKGQKIYDDLLYLQAKSAEKTGKIQLAISSWKEILSFPTEKIHREEALFKLGILFERLNQPEEARKYFLEILENYKDGFFFPEAQKHYRKLENKIS